MSLEGGQARLPAGLEPASRSSIPWQIRDQYPSTIHALYQTAKVMLFEPNQAFSNMRTEQAMGGALIYAVIVGWIFGMIGTILSRLTQVMVMIPFKALVPGAPSPEALGWGLAGELVLTAVVLPVGIVISTFVIAGIVHVMLLLLGGATRGFEATYCVVAYSHGTTAIFIAIPGIGALIQFVWSIVLEILGLTAVHRTTSGKAAAAVLVPIALCCCAAVVVWFSFLAVLITGASGM